MKALLMVAAALVAATAGTRLATDGRAAEPAGSKTPVTLRVGDRIRLEDAPLGCRVVRMQQLRGRVVIDCRRAGPLAGSYGTLLSAREAALVKYSSKRRAKLVAVGMHEQGIRRCR